MQLQDLKSKKPAELFSLAEEHGVEDAANLRKQDLIAAILKKLAEKNVPIFGGGVIEILQDGFGFLRSLESNYLASADDIYISPLQVKRLGLRTGDTVQGQIRAPKETERYFSMSKIEAVNFKEIENIRHRVHFDNLTPLYPNQRLKLEIEDLSPASKKDNSQRVIDLVAPLGKGQRALIVAPPRTGKTVLLQSIAHAISNNHP
ncbi:MAG: Rho termination factor N-terminal domain-containing protein, partial [Alphaproteobacteria bacterium]|nr:Rho termination factor N-terminal domain-containing protein [Alphaproteobacteria bacterium]